jgi:hypothetical protein
MSGDDARRYVGMSANEGMREEWRSGDDGSCEGGSGDDGRREGWSGDDGWRENWSGDAGGCEGKRAGTMSGGLGR